TDGMEYLKLRFRRIVRCSEGIPTIAAFLGPHIGLTDGEAASLQIRRQQLTRVHHPPLHQRRRRQQGQIEAKRHFLSPLNRSYRGAAPRESPRCHPPVDMSQRWQEEGGWWQGPTR